MQKPQSQEMAQISKGTKSMIINDFKNSNMFQREKVPQEIIEQMRSLPIAAKRNELIDLIENNQIVIVIGETGSGNK